MQKKIIFLVGVGWRCSGVQPRLGLIAQLSSALLPGHGLSVPGCAGLAGVPAREAWLVQGAGEGGATSLTPWFQHLKMVLLN